MAPALKTATRLPEDLMDNLRLVEALAPSHCAGCRGYHLARARKRLAAASPDALDRPDIVRLLRGCLRSAQPSFDILIAGVGDTSLLATCAEAMPEEPTARFTILDRCRTPLILCEAFGRRHGLAVQTSQVDLGAPGAMFAADVILVHSLLRFLPAPAHAGTLRRLRDWLKPEGAIIFSHRLIAEKAATEPCYRAEYECVAPILDLIAEAGLRVIVSQEPVEQGGPRHRFLALLKLA